jgi:hypothetical protein
VAREKAPVGDRIDEATVGRFAPFLDAEHPAYKGP